MFTKIKLAFKNWWRLNVCDRYPESWDQNLFGSSKNNYYLCVKLWKYYDSKRKWFKIR